MELDALIRALAPSEVVGETTIDVVDLAYDTRRVRAGALFFCVPGARVDGHDLAADAVERGAVALVVERSLDLAVPQLVVPDSRAAMAVAADVFFEEPTRELEVAGVTGTNGKTTTAFLLHAMLHAAGRAPGLVGTVEWIVGTDARPASFTTPEAIDLQRLLREMLDAGNRSVALEASSHGSALRRLDRVRFDVLVFTNLSQDHLDFHGSLENYFQAKRRLFVGAQPPPAVVNVGDEWGRRLAADLADAHRAPLLTFALDGEADVRAEGLELTPRGSRFTAAGVAVETPLPGRFNAENALGAVAAGLLLGLTDDEIATGIAAVDGIPGRFELVDEGQPYTVVVDYAHTPGSLRAALQAARDLTDARVLVVFGAGGDRDATKRAPMGAVAAELADVVLVTSDNPRSEDAMAVIEDVVRGAGGGAEVDPDRRSAIRRALALAEPGDVVVVAGKGHERGQEVAGVVHPFDDREVVREELRSLAGGAR